MSTLHCTRNGGGGNALIINDYCFKALFCFLFIWLTPHLLKAQDWEVVEGSEINFSLPFAGYPQLSQAGFTSMGFGASGSSLDNCAGVLNFQNAHYIAVQAVLSNAYEYRFSWNVRTITSGK